MMHLAGPNDPIIFTAEIDPISFIGVIMPLRTAEETERALDEDGETIPTAPEKDAEDEDDITPQMFDGAGNPTPAAAAEKTPKAARDLSLANNTKEELQAIIHSKGASHDEREAARDEMEFRRGVELGETK